MRPGSKLAHPTTPFGRQCLPNSRIAKRRFRPRRPRAKGLQPQQRLRCGTSAKKICRNTSVAGMGLLWLGTSWMRTRTRRALCVSEWTTCSQRCVMYLLLIVVLLIVSLGRPNTFTGTLRAGKYATRRSRSQPALHVAQHIPLITNTTRRTVLHVVIYRALLLPSSNIIATTVYHRPPSAAPCYVARGRRAPADAGRRRSAARCEGATAGARGVERDGGAEANRRAATDTSQTSRDTETRDDTGQRAIILHASDAAMPHTMRYLHDANVISYTTFLLLISHVSVVYMSIYRNFGLSASHLEIHCTVSAGPTALYLRFHCPCIMGRLYGWYCTKHARCSRRKMYHSRASESRRSLALTLMSSAVLRTAMLLPTLTFYAHHDAT